MGAIFIEMRVAGHCSPEQVKKIFKLQQQRDAIEKYDPDGYGGGFDTMDNVVIRGLAFYREDGLKDARKFCMRNARKWEYAVAIPIIADTPEESFWLIGGWGSC